MHVYMYTYLQCIHHDISNLGLWGSGGRQLAAPVLGLFSTFGHMAAPAGARAQAWEKRRSGVTELVASRVQMLGF